MVPSIAYHYTSLETALKILGSPHRLHASSIRSCNDGNEYVYGIEVLSKLLKNREGPAISRELKNGPAPYWITCFSACRDDHAQWHLYGDNGRGVCIGFDLSLVLSTARKTFGDQIEIVEVAYTDEQHTTMLQPNADEIIEKNISFTLFREICKIKQDFFQSERETRLLLFQNAWPDEVLNDDHKVKYRARNGILVPHMEIPFPEIAVKQVRFGPGAKSPLNEVHMRNFLRDNGITTAEVDTSEIVGQ